MLKQTKRVSEYELPIKIESQKEGSYVVNCPLWKDYYAQGGSVDDAVLEIITVAQSLIELYKEEDLKIPLKLQKEKQKTCVIPHHHEIKAGTLKSIINQMGLTKEEFEEL